jgi:aromatic-L-amino-acid/L-tryptophan decarboxylase
MWLGLKLHVFACQIAEWFNRVKMSRNPCCQIRPAGQALAGHDQETLDPADWEEFRIQAHHMLDDIVEYIKTIRQRPVWQPIPANVRERFRATVPHGPSALADVHKEFLDSILPFSVGNVHPGFMGWVHGGGTPVGMLAEMLAAGLNVNAGGRNQTPIEVEKQIALWMREIFEFPETASGLFVTGTSMANFIAVVVARDVALGFEARRQGTPGNAKRLTAFGSTGLHGCLSRAMDLCGLGSDALRLIPTDSRRRIDLAALESAIKKDRKAGFHPFLIVGTAGTVDSGAIDDLSGLADLAQREKVWFHVDGAYGALAMLAPDLAPKLRGIERADSLAFDFHKWGQVPYDAGYVMVREEGLQRKAFAASNDYLRREPRGLAGGSPWPCDFGPDLSRGFRALKTWFTFKVYGTEALGGAISRTCALARYLEQRITETAELELLAPVELNIVCFRYRAHEPDRVNAEIVVRLQESGSVAPSTTIIDGQFAIRAAIVNHRTSQIEIDKLIEDILALGRSLTACVPHSELSTNEKHLPQFPPRLKWQAELREVEGRLQSGFESIDLRFRRACLLHELGRGMDARADYIKVLEREPNHAAALHKLSRLLLAMRYQRAALIACKEAVTRHPNDPMSHVNMGQALLEESEQLMARQRDAQALQFRRIASEHFERALRLDADCDKAHEGLSYLVEDEEKRAWHRREAFRNNYIIPLTFRGTGSPIPVLELVSTTGGNVRLQSFLDSHIFHTFIVLPEFYDHETPLPRHKLIVNAIGDAEISAGALNAVQSLLSQTTAPVINPPAAVLSTSRSNNATRLAGLTGVVTPRTMVFLREQLSDSQAASVLADHGLRFPLLLRTPGSHTGLHFLKVDNLASLSFAVSELPGRELIVMQFLDARGPDGKTRKYRVMMINGQLYPLHCAISSQWKIHYFTAEMDHNADHRKEDKAFLDNMPAVLGPLAMNALSQIQQMLALDYAGIDFGLNANGELLLFEANATMVVNPPEPGEQWKYRLPAYEQIRAAVHRMLIERADPSLGVSNTFLQYREICSVHQGGAHWTAEPHISLPPSAKSEPAESLLLTSQSLD